MKILIIRTFPYELNINSYNCQELGLAKALIRKGHQCDIVLFTAKNEDYEDIIKCDDTNVIHIFYMKARNFLNNGLFGKKIFKIIKEYDMIQCSEYDQIFNRKIEKYAKHMVIYHGPYASKYTKGYNKKCMLSDFIYLFHRQYKKTMCIAKSSLAEEFLRKKGFYNVKTVGVGIDLEKLNLDTEINLKIKELEDKKKTENLQYLLHIGRLVEDKNTLFLVDLYNKIHNKHSNVRLIIVGNGKEDYKNLVFEKIKQYGLEKNVIYFDKLQQKEIAQLYKIADIFLLPSKYEIFGMVLLEAMYFGLPVLTTLNGGSSTLIKNEENGFICKLDEIEKWEGYIDNLLKDKTFYNKISKNAKSCIENHFTWDKLADEFIKIYEKVEKSNEN